MNNKLASRISALPVEWLLILDERPAGWEFIEALVQIIVKLRQEIDGLRYEVKCLPQLENWGRTYWSICTGHFRAPRQCYFVV